MKNLRRNWLKLPSGLVVGVALDECALDACALALENGDCVSISGLAVSDRAAIWTLYTEHYTALRAVVA